MKRSATYLLLTLTFLFMISPCLYAQQVVTIEPTKPAPPALQVSDLLPDKLAGATASGAVKTVARESLAELVSDRAAIYQEYKVTAAASRLYGATRVDIFQTESPFAAFGLFSYQAPAAGKDTKSGAAAKPIGSGSAVSSDGLIFWKNNYFIKLTNPAAKALIPAHSGMALAIAGKIADNSQDEERPTFYQSLPKDGLVAASERYVLGAQSLTTYVAGAANIFPFAGDAEAVVADYQIAGAGKPVKLFIIEYHTPQFATQAMAQSEGQLNGLADEAKDRLIIKRVGNFIVGATDFTDREGAEELIGKVEYPYVVKWLQNPAIPTDDPFRIQKTATMLVSTFTLIGLTGGLMLGGGILFGTFIFIKRRKQQRAIFSDAGGMLRLQLDPVEDSILGLLPERGTED